MMISILLLGLFHCVLFEVVAAVPASTRNGQVSDNPSAANFLRRAYHGSAVLGDYVFISGGEFSQLVDGVPDSGQGSVPITYIPFSRQNNVTLSIDLRTSWTNASVSLQTISQGSAPVLNLAEYWIHPDGKAFYLWDGELSPLSTAPNTISNSLWEFSSDENGGGTGIWSQEPINYTGPSSATLQSLFRPCGGSATTIGDTGYYVGGRVWQRSDADASPVGYFQNTITSFNMSSRLWTNDLNTSIGSLGATEGASARSITALGLDNRGLMILIGGRNPGTNVSAPPGNYYDLSNITIYDPYIDVWYAQQASGEIPSPRELFCAVTVLGDNGTYEIFIYGGYYQGGFDNWNVYNDVYVLTIPGFVWFRLQNPAAAAARFAHTCELVGGRQLLSIGGLDNPIGAVNQYGDYAVPDPFIQGIGIFDMTAAAWKSGYDAHAPPYQSPQIVKDWYAAGNQASVPWQSLELARMFIRDTPVSVSPTPTATGSETTRTAGGVVGNQDGGGNATTLGLGLGLPSLIAAFVGVWYTWRTYRLKKAKSNKKKSPAASQISDEPVFPVPPLLATPIAANKTTITRSLSQNELAGSHACDMEVGGLEIAKRD